MKNLKIIWFNGKQSRINLKSIMFFLIVLICLTITSSQQNPPIQSSQTNVVQFTAPAYTDLSLKRVGDKLNITFGNNYATIKGYFFYEGNTFTFAQAAAQGVTYDSWVNYNTGTTSKFGGMINVSSVNPIMKSNGYFVVFELTEISEGLDYSICGDSLCLDNGNVKIQWKDYENPNNKFQIFNKTIVYLTDNGKKFHDTFIYDPQVQVANLSVGIYNNTRFVGSIMNINNNDLDLQFENGLGDIGQYNLQSVSNIAQNYTTDDKGTKAIVLLSDSNTNYITPNSYLNSNTTNLTILAYVNLDPATSAISMLTHKYLGNYGYYFYFDNTNNRIAFVIGNSTGTIPEASAINTVTFGEWKCYGLTVNNYTQELRYFNGSATAFDTDTLDGNAIFGTTSNIYLGKDNSDNNDLVGNVSRILINYRWYSDQEAYDWCNAQQGGIYTNNGTYTTQVFARNMSNGDANSINWTINSLSLGTGLEVELATRTDYNIPQVNNLIAWFDWNTFKLGDTTVQENTGRLKNVYNVTTKFTWGTKQTYKIIDGRYERALYNYRNDTSTSPQSLTTVQNDEMDSKFLLNTFNWTMCFWTNFSLGNSDYLYGYNGENGMPDFTINNENITHVGVMIVYKKQYNTTKHYVWANKAYFIRNEWILLCMQRNDTHITSIGFTSEYPQGLRYVDVGSATETGSFIGSGVLFNDSVVSENGFCASGVQSGGVNGTCDDIFIWNLTLSTLELEQVYNESRYWTNYSLYQSFSSGTTTHNYSVSPDFSFYQGMVKIPTNTSESAIVYGINSTTWNYTATAGGDTTPPYITIAPTNITTTNQSILWNVTFNEASNMSGTYGVCPTYTTTAFSNSSVSTTLISYQSSLANATTYCYNLTYFCDATPNCNSTGYIFNFTTLQNELGCTPTWTNTSWFFSHNNSCYINDSMNATYNLTQYDSTGCNATNTTFTKQVFNETCNYCSYNIANTSWTSELNQSCQINDNMQVMRNLTEYDSNYSTCYAITSIATDLWNSGNNNTYYNYTNISSCNYCSYNIVNSSWFFSNNNTCYINDSMNATYNRTEYDSNYSTCYAITNIATDLWNSGNNNTYQTYIFNETCNYCSYNIANTSWTSELNQSCQITDNMTVMRNLTEYDSNYSTCYAITSIATDLWNSGNNITFFNYTNISSCNYCSYNIVNSSWFFSNNNTCYINDSMNSTYNRTEYDSNYSTCYSITNIATDLWNSGNNNTYQTYIFNETCNYCSYNIANTSWTSELNQSCQINDNMQVMRNLTEYDSNYSTCYAITSIATDLWNSGNNNTYYNYTNISSCNYCSYNVANTSWGAYTNLSCISTNLMNRSANRTEYDNNYSTCFAITNISTDQWNSGNNNTYYNYSPSGSCNYLGCPNITSIINTSTTNESTYIQFNSSESVNYSIYVTSWLDNNTFALFHNTYWDSLMNSTSYSVNLTVWDDYGCNVSNNTFSFTTSINTDITPPIIKLDSPLNNTWDEGTVTFKYTPTDSNLDTCLLYHNASGWAVNKTNDTVTSGSQDSHSVTLLENFYLWNVWCNDTLGNSVWNLTNYTIKIDTTAPTPCDTGAMYYGASYGSNFEYNCNSQDNGSGIYNYFINETGNFSINASGFVTNITNLQPHVWYLNISINDSVGNINSVLWTINISDTSAPALDINYPTNNGYYQDVYWLNFSIRDDFPNNITINDSRWVRNFSNSSYSSFYNSSSQPEGNYTIEVQYNDTWGNEGHYNLTFTIDRTTPLTSLVAPANASSWTTSSLVVFIYNVTDTNPIDNCEYDVDSPSGGSGGSDTTITRNTNQTFNYTLVNANWEWFVNCTDEAGNWNATNKWNVTVNYVTLGGGGGGGGENVTIPLYLGLPTNITLPLISKVVDIDWKTIFIFLTLVFLIGSIFIFALGYYKKKKKKQNT